MVGFGEAVGGFFGKYSRIEGRAARSEIGWMALLLGALLAGAAAMTGAGAVPGFVMVLVVVTMAPPWLTLTVRRLHDTGRSGRWCLAPWLFWLAAMPITAQVYVSPLLDAVALVLQAAGVALCVFVLACMGLPGTAGPNRYGTPSDPA